MNYNGVEYLDSVKDVSPSRITWIANDGNVIFDNRYAWITNAATKKRNSLKHKVRDCEWRRLNC